MHRRNVALKDALMVTLPQAAGPSVDGDWGKRRPRKNGSARSDVKSRSYPTWVVEISRVDLCVEMQEIITLSLSSVAACLSGQESVL